MAGEEMAPRQTGNKEKAPAPKANSASGVTQQTEKTEGQTTNPSNEPPTSHGRLIFFFVNSIALSQDTP